MTDPAVILWGRLEEWCENVVRQKRRLLGPWVHLGWEMRPGGEESAAEVWLTAVAAFTFERWVHAKVYARIPQGEWDECGKRCVYAVEMYESTKVILQESKILVLPGYPQRRS